MVKEYGCERGNIHSSFKQTTWLRMTTNFTWSAILLPLGFPQEILHRNTASPIKPSLVTT